jgi:prepilin-type N-terminal cleavage/methylation domain-containing protein
MSSDKLIPTIPRRPGGFTLLEVMLALALSAVVVAMVAEAIDIHLRMVDTSRGNVEEALLARTLFNLIAEDLRNAPQYNPPDAEKMLLPISSADAAGGTGTGAQQGEDTEAVAPEEEQPIQPEEETDTGSTLWPQSFPGLFGNASEIQIDTSRLPRSDELDAAFYEAPLMMASQLSEVKTVSYRVIGETPGAQGFSEGSSGLVRCEFDRAAAIYAANNGMLSELNREYVEPIAPEVAGIEFAYFDGSGWVQEWDSEAYGYLPLAVEIVLKIIPLRRYAELELASQGGRDRVTLDRNEQLLVYRRVVELPVAQIPAEETASAETQ